MSTPYMSQISVFAFDIVPKGWMPCNGQLLSINQYQALFSLLGTTYGGNGTTNFALPNLQGRVPVGTGNSAWGTFTPGQAGGSETVGLTTQQIPMHTHPVAASSQSTTTSLTGSPQGNYPAAPSTYNLYESSANTTLDSGSSSSGGSQPHPNLQPYLTVQYCIAIVGIFPTRN